MTKNLELPLLSTPVDPESISYFSKSNLKCGSCSRCCTTDSLNKNRTPIYEKDTQELKVTPEYFYSEARQCNSCKYLSEEGLCNSYDDRPFICRAYPFTPILVEGQPSLALATYNCHLGESFYLEIMRGNEKIISKAHDVLAEASELMTDKEWLDQTKSLFSAYKFITILNI